MPTLEDTPISKRVRAERTRFASPRGTPQFRNDGTDTPESSKQYHVGNSANHRGSQSGGGAQPASSAIPTLRASSAEKLRRVAATPGKPPLSYTAVQGGSPISVTPSKGPRRQRLVEPATLTRAQRKAQQERSDTATLGGTDVEASPSSAYPWYKGR